MKVAFVLFATFVAALQYTQAEPVGTCPSDMNPEKVDFLVDDGDCTVFYKCDWGKAVKFDCPSGLHFNKDLEVCDWPDRAGCGGNSEEGNSNSDSSSSSESDEDEEEVVTETQTEAEPEPEPEEEESDSSSSSSSSESNETGSNEGNSGKCPNDKCPAVNNEYPVYFAHPETCGRFCQCDWGVAYDMPCPDGLHFNTELNVCDWPADAGCDI